MSKAHDSWFDWSLRDEDAGKLAWDMTQRLYQGQGARRCQDADDYLAL